MIRNSTTTWGGIAQAFHWIGGALILFLLGHGWWMVAVPPREMRFAQYGWHASIGYALLALMIARLLWRWLNAVPALPSAAKAWERASARINHWGLYLLILADAVSGWALAGTFRRPLEGTLFGLRVPNVVSSRDPAVHELLENSHSALAWALAALIVVHFVGAFYHLLVKRDGVMQRMLPSFARR